MYYLLYNNISGNLVDISSEEFPQDRLESGLVLETRDSEMPDLSRFYWNKSTLNFERKHVKELSKLEFLSRFTLQERVSARSSSDPIVIDIMKMLDIAEFINTEDQMTIQSIGYLVSIGLLTAERYSEILS